MINADMALRRADDMLRESQKVMPQNHPAYSTVERASELVAQARAELRE